MSTSYSPCRDSRKPNVLVTKPTKNLSAFCFTIETVCGWTQASLSSCSLSKILWMIFLGFRSLHCWHARSCIAPPLCRKDGLAFSHPKRSNATCAVCHVDGWYNYDKRFKPRISPSRGNLAATALNWVLCSALLRPFFSMPSVRCYFQYQCRTKEGTTRGQ